jgi:hypothetical protein
VALSQLPFERVEQMTYDIGDLIVRHFNHRYYWNMLGLISGKRQVDGETYYKIKWLDPKHHTNSDRWQHFEFEHIDIAKKLEQNT